MTASGTMVPYFRSHGRPVHVAVIASTILTTTTLLAWNPLLGTLLLTAPLLAMAMLVRPELATATVVFTLYSNVAVVAATFHGVPRVIAGAFPLLLMLPFFNEIFVRRKPIIVDKVVLLFLGFIAIQLVGVTVAVKPRASLQVVQDTLLEGAFIYFVMVNVIRTRRQLQVATWALVAAGIFMATIPIYQQITGTFNSNFGGLGQLNELGFGVEGGKKQHRLCGSIGEQNRFAQTMLMVIPVAGLLLTAQKHVLLRASAALGLVLSCLGSALAFSRGAAISSLLLIFAMVGLRIIKIKQLLKVGLLCMLVLVALPQYWGRLVTIQDVGSLTKSHISNREEPDGAIKGRATEMLAAALVFMDYPFTGVGPGMFKHYSREYGNSLGIRRLKEDRHAHNLYLELAAETGVLGLGAFLGIVGYAMWRLRELRLRLIESHPAFAHIAAGYMLSIFVYLASGIFLHMSYGRFFYLILALAGATMAIGERLLRQSDKAGPHAAE